jgi:hypothetical protein
LDFGRNINLMPTATRDMLVNAINWAAQQDSLINLTPKTQTSRIVAPPLDGRHQPGHAGDDLLACRRGFVAAGVGVWIARRRHK